MLAVSRALMMNPRLLIMDEPTEGLAPLIVAQVAEVVEALKQQSQSILLVEQDLSFALAVTDYVYALSKGTIVFSGLPDELRDRHDIQSMYLGI